MANTEPAPGLQAPDFTEQRNDALREGVKGLFLMNGGGTVAMLAFLQAIWTDKPQLAKYVVVSITFLAAGGFLAGVVGVFWLPPSIKFSSRRAFAVLRSTGVLLHC